MMPREASFSTSASSEAADHSSSALEEEVVWGLVDGEMSSNSARRRETFFYISPIARVE